jgi:dTDP-4-dehydrorhamnose reductase
MKKNILVIGAKGMLGMELVSVYGQNTSFEVVGWDIDDVDITKKDDLYKKLKELTPKPHIVVNTAAYTNVDKAEEEKDKAFEINAYGPMYLAAITNEMNIPLMHFSTDYVFDGKKVDGYFEKDDDYLKPVNVYGQSKLKGEELVKKYNSKHYIIRMSWLFGKHGRNFVTKILDLAENQASIEVVNDQVGNPTYAKDIALETVQMIREKASFGVYHLTNTTPDDAGVKWEDLARKAIEIKGLPTTVVGVPSSTFPSKAKRPQYSILLNSRRRHLRFWENALLDYLKEVF